MLKHKGSYSIDYSEIENAEIRKKRLGGILKIRGKDKKYKFLGLWNRRDLVPESLIQFKDVAEILKEKILDRLSIIT